MTVYFWYVFGVLLYVMGRNNKKKRSSDNITPEYRKTKEAKTFGKNISPSFRSGNSKTD